MIAQPGHCGWSAKAFGDFHDCHSLWMARNGHDCLCLNSVKPALVIEKLTELASRAKSELERQTVPGGEKAAAWVRAQAHDLHDSDNHHRNGVCHSSIDVHLTTDSRLVRIRRFCDNSRDSTQLEFYRTVLLQFVRQGGKPSDLAVRDGCVVMEPPSQELVRQLTELQLCHPSDLHRARGRVRRLAFDLTVFDSVWIDSLVQLRLLTPYQAKQLEGGHADQLRIGSFIAIDELGRSSCGTTLLARRLQRRDRCVVKRQTIDADRMTEVGQRMQFVLERAKGFAHPQLVLPNETVPADGNELLTVSRYVPGLPLNELLVRRGRFPAAVVFEIGRQLLDGLSALHARSLVHGDVRMSNVRLTDTGLAVLVDGGTRHVVHPEITIHDTLSLEAYDGLAPELIGTGASPTASSEMYALGCLLWQLLAGRPPFTTADPLAKMAAHQTQTIDDVRMWAPETPSVLAEVIRQMTSPAAALRPRSFEELLQKWGRPSSFGRSRLKQYRRLFDGRGSSFRRIRTVQQNRSGAVWIAAMLFALTGGVAMLYDRGLHRIAGRGQDRQFRCQPSRANSDSKGLDRETGGSTNDATSASYRRGAVLPLPSPSADGVILLREDGPFAPTAIMFAGNLTIRAANWCEAGNPDR